jgi:hypothetical protein
MAGKPTHTLIRLLAVLVAATLAFAHGNLEHVTGTVTKISGDSVTVATTAGTTVEVAFDAKTTYSRMDQPITKTAIQVGERVVIHAAKDGTKLIAHTVVVGTAKKAH